MIYYLRSTGGSVPVCRCASAVWSVEAKVFEGRVWCQSASGQSLVRTLFAGREAVRSLMTPTI